MKEFNLEEAKAGKAVCTRDGRKVRIICWDMKGGYPIVALVEEADGEEVIQGYDQNGHVWCRDYTEDMERHDLMIASEKKEGWVNLYKTESGVYPAAVIAETRDAAYNGRSNKDYLATIKIEWEE